MGIVGYGVCQFGAAFGFQDHPNVTVAAVSDLFPDRCPALAKVCRCAKTYPSLEELVKDDSIEAVFVATDAPSHARHCIDVLRHGKHVASRRAGRVRLARGRPPAARGGQVERAEVHDVRDLGLPRRLPRHAGDLSGRRVRQAHLQRRRVLPLFGRRRSPRFANWRVGVPPQWYPTHSNAYYVCVTGGSFTEVTCMGMPSLIKELQPENNQYKNPFGTEIALLRTSEGGMSRMAVSWDTPGPGGETGRVYGQRGSMVGMNYTGEEKKLPDLERPPLPPSVAPGGHGGSHGHLMNEFVTAILEDRKPLVDIAMALNLTVPGIVAHQSALKGGERLKIPQFAEYWDDPCLARQARNHPAGMLLVPCDDRPQGKFTGII